jgi:hypothetical protein
VSDIGSSPPPNGSALSCRPPVHQDATTDGRPANPPRTGAAGGWRARQAPTRRPVSCSALLGGVPLRSEELAATNRDSRALGKKS